MGHTVSARRSLPENGPGSPTPSCSYCDASCFLSAQRLASPALALGGAEVSLMGEQHLGLKYFVIQLTFQQFDHLLPQIVVFPVLGADPVEGPGGWGRATWKAKSSGEKVFRSQTRNSFLRLLMK